MQIGKRIFARQGKTYIMGILNVTPDSFSDGGKWNEADRALRHAEEMVRDGADIIDVGGESTRPGYTELAAEEEIERVVPVIERLKRELDVPISLDTCKGAVAQAGIAAGADLINDIRGLKHDRQMAAVIAESGLPCCLMHSRLEADYEDFWRDMKADIAETMRLAQEAGIGTERIILDPGVGFGKTYAHNLEVLRHLERMREFGCPVLLGCSRKSVIGLTLQLPVEERLEGTLATTVAAVYQGCSFVRVHDVRENKRAIQMTEAILYGGM